MFLRAAQRPRSEVYYHVSHSVALQRGLQAALHAPLCHSECLSLAPSVSPPLPGFQHRGTRRRWVPQMELKCLVPQLSAMQIALSSDSISENSQQSVLFDAFFLFISCHDVIICGTAAASLVNVSDSHLLISLSLSLSSSLCLYLAEGLPPLLHGLLQHLQRSHTVSVFVLLSRCREANCLRGNTRHQGKLSRPRSQKLLHRHSEYTVNHTCRKKQ